MREHFGAVEADFQSYYGLDIREVLWGPKRFGARRLWSLVRGLPLDGAVVRAVSYVGRSWSVTDELLATLVELTDHGNRMYFGAHAKKTERVWEPVKIERPWKETVEPISHRPTQPRKQSTPSEMREDFGDNIIHDYTPGPREGE